ncbi:hypothetical protein WICMUC_001914 [Wickerhamomyces mucosus]|uniref:RNA helicase n=1 Tax=Wickerhamomyces mucosus TaxID=1378264 RepID=A0A9P8PRC9_9ASCO|nr:hypothetical protein WICMUC_001914 [Wickerhamomyces mucosus]
MSLEKIRHEILQHVGANEPEIADFVVNLHDQSTSFEEFNSSLEDMGGEFSEDFLKKIYEDLEYLKRFNSIKKEEDTKLLKIPISERSSEINQERKNNNVEISRNENYESTDKVKTENDGFLNAFLGLPNETFKREIEDGDDLIKEWKDFKSEDINDNISRKRSYKGEEDQLLDPSPQLDKVYKGIVKNVTNFGAFVHIYGIRGNVDGLVHISSISESRVSHPSDIVKRNQEVFIKVININGSRVGLSMKDVDQITGEPISGRPGRELHVGTTKTIKKRLTSPERWEIRQLISSGALAAENYPDLDDNSTNGDDQVDEEINVEVKQELPPFLAGLNIEPEKITIDKTLQAPDGSLSRAAASGSALARERRELKLKHLKEEKERKLREKSGKLQDDIKITIENDDSQVAEEEIGSDEWKLNQKQKNVSFGKRTSMSMKEQRESLPVFKMRDELLRAIHENQFIVIVGETGSGKTTQLTQYLNEDGFARDGIIACTQPRRVAATSVAKRVSEEMGVKLGEEVGYTVRFDDKTSPRTQIKYMTDGMLQREAIKDPDMSQYSVVMLDEAHERTIATDILFALLKKAASRRPDLKIIATSATLNAKKFSTYFNDCPVVNIPGRTFQVEKLFSSQPVMDYLLASLDAIMKIHLEEPKGDILVFLTGQEEIETSIQVLEEKIKNFGDTIPELIILPVYSALPSEMQSRIFEPTPKGSRKVILATNIAETSLTIDGIYYVIDPGFAKINAYDAKLGMDSLVVRPISQAQANQRAGRAGRTGPGKCFRLYTELAFKNEMLPNTIPEIQRQNLSNTILMLKAIGINDLLNFEFMDPPSKESIMLSLNDLYFLGAVDQDSRITKIGRNLVNIPADPTISKTLIESIHYRCSDEMITVFAMVSTPNIFHRPKKEQELADKKKARFTHPHGDHLTYLNIYNAWVNNGYSKTWCEDNFIQERSLKRARDIRNQLLQIFKRVKYPILSCGADTNAVRKALCSGFFKNIAKRDREGSYKTLAEGTVVYIHPSSSIRSSPQYVLYNSILNTTKEYLVHVTIIEPHWLVEVSPDFFEINGKQTEAKKQSEKINPLFNRFNRDQNHWRLSKPFHSTKKRFRAG